MPDQDKRSFEELSRDESDVGLVREFWEFLAQNKKWWLVPILILFAIFGILLSLMLTGVAPFLYPLF